MRSFGVDVAATSLFAVFQALLSPFVLIVAVQRGAAPWEVGLLTAAPNAAMLLSGWYARLAERRRLVPWVSWTSGLGRALLLLGAWGSGLGLFLGAYCGFSILSAASNPAYTAIERAIYHERWRGQLMAGVRTALGLVQFLGTLVAGRLMDAYGSARVWTVAVIFGIGSAVVFTRMPEPASAARPAGSEPRDRVAGRGALALAAADPRFRALIVAVMLAGGGNLLVAPGYPLYQVHRLHLTDGAVADLTAVWALAWTVCYPLWGRICDRRRPALVVALACGCYVVPPLCYAAGAHLPVLLGAYLVQGVGDSALDAGWQNHVMRLAGDRIGVYAAAYYTFLGVRGTLMPMLGAAAAARFGLVPLFLAGAAMVLAGLWCARRLPDAPLPLARDVRGAPEQRVAPGSGARA